MQRYRKDIPKILIHFPEVLIDFPEFNDSYAFIKNAFGTHYK